LDLSNHFPKHWKSKLKDFGYFYIFSTKMKMRHTLSQLTLLAAFFGYSVAQNCALIVPNDPLTATGLATPYQLANIAGDPNSGNCDQAAVAAFVQGAFIDTMTGQIKVYNPLVINQGTTAAINPTAPTLPTNSVVALWFGFNGNKLLLQPTAGGNGLTAGNCVTGFGGAPFGQFAYCNAPAFFNAANNAILEGTLVVPQLGTANDGKPCPTVRDFAVVDQDQSDNVLTEYLMVTSAAGVNTFAQNTPANRNTLGGTAAVVTNASDNRLINLAIDVALGCTAWTVPDAADTTGATMVGALPLNELLAAYRQATPQAMVPENDPMAQVNGASSIDKINLYRQGVNQPTIQAITDAPALDYCQKYSAAAFNRIQPNMARFSQFPSPHGMAANLYQFLVNTRFVAAIGGNGGLNCVNMGVANPFLAMNNQNANILAANFTLITIIGITAGALVLIGVGTAVFVYIKRSQAQKTAELNFMSL
jgi:hypothetical protein